MVCCFLEGSSPWQEIKQPSSWLHLLSLAKQGDYALDTDFN